MVRKDCSQFLHDTPGTPLLPPDYINESCDNSYDGAPRTSTFHDAVLARDAYNELRAAPCSVKRQRRYVFGAMYEFLFPGYLEVDPMIEDYDLFVTLPSKKVSVVRIRLVSPVTTLASRNLLTSVVELGKTLSGPGNCRGKDVGDMGSMHAIGLKSAKSKSCYVAKENTAAMVEVASAAMTEWMQDNMRDVLAKIRGKDEEMKVERSAAMKDAPGSRMMISVNLANSPHYDTGDSSESVAIWVEEKPGQSKNWYFVLPNVSCAGSKGVVIKLMHGLVISWDGREIYHCSSITDVGNSNKVYGCLWTSTRSA